MAAPALMQMAIPNLIASAQNPQTQANAIIQAALKQQQGGAGQPSAPGMFAPGGGVSSMMNGGIGNGLLSKLFPQAPGAGGGSANGPIDPNSGLPVTPDVMAGAAAMGGPPAPSPTALTGLW